jgi:RNA polymerase sigma factor (sigma-70 family)
MDVDAVEATSGQPHDAVFAERRRRVVRELLETLPEEQAETFAMRVAMGFSLPEVAAATGAPLNTVRSRIRLAKEALRRRIDADPKLVELLEVES